MNKIALIKLGALGDVIRTLPIASAIKSANPDSQLVWITKKEALEILKNEKQIDKILALPYNSKGKFDILYNFDIDEEATALANKIQAERKIGFYSQEGYVSAFNLGAEYYLNTLFDDSLKKSNRKTYQQMMFEAAEMIPNRKPYELSLTNEEIALGKAFIKKHELSGKKVVGLHVGASPRWPSKAWAEESIKEFIIKARKSGNEIILFGGPNEIEKHDKLIRNLETEGVMVHTNNPNNTFREFISLVSICDFMVCSDSLALHVAVGLGKPTVALFFCTSPHEVESYGLIKKIISPMLEDFFPEKMDQYDEKLTRSISADQVLNAINKKWKE